MACCGANVSQRVHPQDREHATTASNSSVVVINDGLGCNVFWQIGSSATLGTGTTFTGNILALTSITLTTSARIFGRALARDGAVTLDTNTIDSSACFTTTTPGPTPVPTLAGWAMIALTGLLGLAGIVAMRRRAIQGITG